MRLLEHNDDIKIWQFVFIQIIVIETHTNRILTFLAFETKCLKFVLFCLFIATI